MRSRSLTKVGLFFLTVLLFCFVRDTFARPVLMISIDGMRPDLVTKADAQELRIPNLRHLMMSGTYAEGVVGVLPTSTFPSHTTLITGVWPAEHGIYANQLFDPLGRNNDGSDNFAADIRVPTLFDAAHAKGLVTASLSWPVTVGATGIDYNLPLIGPGASEEATKWRRVVARPAGLLQQLEEKLRQSVDSGDSIKADEIRTRFAIEIMRTKRPDFIAVHLSAVDGESHKHGPFSREAKAALEALDSQIGQLSHALFENDPKGVTVVVSDHGFLQTDYRVNWRVAFVEAGLLELQSSVCKDSKPIMKDWRASLWGGGGSAAVILKDPNDDDVLKSAVRNVLEKIKSDPAHPIARIIDGEKAKQMGGWPDAAFVVELQPGFQFGDAGSGPLVTSAPSMGTHWYFPDRQEMRSAFFIAGAGIARGRNLGVIDMRQIAATIARILGVSLPTAKAPILNVGAP